MRTNRAVVSDEQFRQIVTEASEYAVFMLDCEGRILSWNAGAQKIKGYTEDEVVGRSFELFYTKEDRERLHPQSELVKAQQDGSYAEEGWRLRKDGTRFWASVTITRMMTPDGKPLGFSKITRDLTARMTAEMKLRESEERFRLIVESIKDYAIIMLDASGVVVSWNEGARRLKGYETTEIVGQHFSKFYEREEIMVGKCEYELKEAAITGRFEDEGWRLRKDGTRFWANVVITALQDSKGVLRGYAKVTRDMTERRRAEERLKLSHQTLELRVAERTLELQKAVQSRDEFISVASHELRTPLTPLHLQQQLLDRHLRKHPGEGLSAAAVIEMAEISRRQLDQLARLVEDMLDVARLASGKFSLERSECDLGELVSSVALAFADVSVEVEPNVVGSWDPQRLTQVLMNLLSNAVKYGGGTPIVVVARRVSPSVCEVVVRDSGPGIAPEDHARIFERFERASPSSKTGGLGLGLYITKKIVESHGGTIEVRSAAGAGAAFVVRLLG